MFERKPPVVMGRAREYFEQVCRTQETPTMGKHKRLFDMLPDGARRGIVHRPYRGSDRHSYGMVWYFNRSYLPKDAADSIIEHAARLHYEGKGYRFIGDGKTYKALALGMKTTDPRPLIDALLAAAEHAREGEGVIQVDPMTDDERQPIRLIGNIKKSVEQSTEVPREGEGEK
jgi:hypothetical protein